MALPDFQTIMRPILVSLTTGEAHSLPQIKAEIA
jgi:restriction endonuclease Mrr